MFKTAASASLQQRAITVQVGADADGGTVDDSTVSEAQQWGVPVDSFQQIAFQVCLRNYSGQPIGGDCSWTAQATTNWIFLTGGTFGRGRGRVTFSVLANPGIAPRSGRIILDSPTAAAEVVNINQDGRNSRITLCSDDVPKEGSIICSTLLVSQRKPVAYQEINGIKRIIPVRYTLDEGECRKLKTGTVGFEIGSYDRSRPLTIDPCWFIRPILAAAALIKARALP